MKTSDTWYTSITSTDSPIEQADDFSRSQSPVTSARPLSAKTSLSQIHGSTELQKQHAQALPFLIASALISGLSLLGLLGFLVMQFQPETQPVPVPQDSVS